MGDATEVGGGVNAVDADLTAGLAVDAKHIVERAVHGRGVHGSLGIFSMEDLRQEAWAAVLEARGRWRGVALDGPLAAYCQRRADNAVHQLVLHERQRPRVYLGVTYDR